MWAEPNRARISKQLLTELSYGESHLQFASGGSMLWDQVQFGKAVTLAWSELVKTKPGNYESKLKEIYKWHYKLDRWNSKYEQDLRNKEFELNCEYGYQFYLKANRSALNSLVLGPETIRQRTPILSNFGISAEVPYENAVQAQTKEFSVNSVKVANPTHASTTEGAVLAEANWWPFLNDAWVLGGVHNLATFYLHIPGTNLRLRDDVLWDSEANRARVLGRELIVLAAFGYRRMIVKDPPGAVNKLKEALGYVFAPVDRELTQSATFEKLCQAVATISSAREIQDLLSSRLGIEYESYDYGVMRSNSFVAKEDVGAFFESAIGSIHDRILIRAGSLLDIHLGGKNGHLKVQVSNASIAIIRTGVPTEVHHSWNGIVYMDKGLFSPSSQVVTPRTA
jgi:hypothetical protein